VDAIRKTGGLVADNSTDAIDLKEPVYWRAVKRLENLKPLEGASHSEIQIRKFELDIMSGGATTFEEWINSLKNRGLI
jgi:hypothetical protein